MVQWLSLVLASSIGAGTNAYLTVFAIGLYARFGEAAPQVQEAIEPFGSYWVIVPAGAMFLVEFLADKIPLVDNLWDALHTLVRPMVAIFVALTLARDLDGALQVAAATGAGGISLGAHGLKAGVRGLARLNPEPTTNALSSPGLSLLENLSVAGLIALVFTAPGIALVLIGMILAAMCAAGPRIFRLAVLVMRSVLSRFSSIFGWRRRPTEEAKALDRKTMNAWLSARPGAQVECWIPCHVHRGGVLDYGAATMVVGGGALVTIQHRLLMGPRLDTLPLDAVRNVLVTHGPLADRLRVVTEHDTIKVLTLAGDRSALRCLRGHLEAGRTAGQAAAAASSAG